jgi:isopentenyl-diphosphate delta-isomerase
VSQNRERNLVELVTSDGAPEGIATVLDAHTAPGARHRAFSVVLLDPAGRTLLQQRAAGKTRFPLRWANACCGHPLPGEAVTVAATRRVQQELGVQVDDLDEVGVYQYRADDPTTGLVECEYDHVIVGRVDAALPLAPDPAEVAAVQWTDAHALARELTGGAPSLATLAERDQSSRFAPWLSGVIRLAIGFSPPV